MRRKLETVDYKGGSDGFIVVDDSLVEAMTALPHKIRDDAPAGALRVTLFFNKPLEDGTQKMEFYATREQADSIADALIENQ